MTPLPASVLGLIEYLEARNPNRCMLPGESLQDHHRYAGRVDLINELRSRYDAEVKAQKGRLPNVF